MYLYLYLYCTLYFVPEILTHVQQSTFKVQKGTKDQVLQMISNFQEWKIVFLDKQNMDFSIF